MLSYGIECWHKFECKCSIFTCFVLFCFAAVIWVNRHVGCWAKVAKRKLIKFYSIKKSMRHSLRKRELDSEKLKRSEYVTNGIEHTLLFSNGVICLFTILNRLRNMRKKVRTRNKASSKSWRLCTDQRSSVAWPSFATLPGVLQRCLTTWRVWSLWISLFLISVWSS